MKRSGPARRRACVETARASLGVSEHRAYRALGQHRSAQREAPRMRHDEAALTADIVELAKTRGRYGYRRITALLCNVRGLPGERQAYAAHMAARGLKVQQKQPKCGRFWLNDDSCVHLRASWPNHVWPHDFVEIRADDHRKFGIPRLIDEYTREALAIRAKRRLNSMDVVEALADAMLSRGRPDYIRSDNGPEFIARALRGWVA